MEVNGWCGHCGESFRLRELVAHGYSGRCPHCDRELSPDYSSVASAALHELLDAAAALQSAGARLHEVAPRLHVDARALTADIDTALGAG